MDYLFLQTFLLYQRRGIERFSLGMAPMAGFAPSENASPEERAVHAFFQHLGFMFSFRGIKAYKASSQRRGNRATSSIVTCSICRGWRSR